jgi:hypothetical protein
VFATSPTLTTPISATLTSPAATNLTLAGGAGNSSIILTPAGTGGVGIGTTGPLAALHVLSADSGGYGSTNRGQISAYTSDAQAANKGGVICLGGKYSTSDATPITYGFVAGKKESSVNDNADGYLAFGTSLNSTSPYSFERMRISSLGVVSISNSTAGSAGAGALVVTGGLATGAASYFGGVITATGDRPFQSVNDGKTWIVGPSTDGNFYITQVGVGSLRVSHTSGNVAILGTISPQQATTASAPAYVKGAIYFDTTLNKLRVGGATTWETITST